MRLIKFWVVAWVVVLSSFALVAQTAQTIYFRAVMSTDNETPAITGVTASGAATIAAHIVFDSTGKPQSASVDFSVNYAFGSDSTVTGLHIHKAPAGTAGPVTINTGLSGSNTVAAPAGSGNITRQAQVKPDDAAGMDTINGLLQDPSQFYVNLHTTVNPGGLMRAQLQRADVIYLMGQMLPGNETPAIPGLNASGMAEVVAIAARNAAGVYTSGTVTLSSSYNFPSPVTFTGLHIHAGAAGTAGPVTINSGLTSLASDPSGAGSVTLTADVSPTNAAALQTLTGLFSNPLNYYINIHTTANPGGAIRAQLRKADVQNFQVTLSPANETPAIPGLNATGIASVSVATLSGSDGTVQGGFAVFDVNYRFPAAVTFTGMHIHDGAAGAAGPVRINTGLSSVPSTADGFGNLYVVVPAQTGATMIATLNSILTTPELQYVNVHTSDNPGGAVRSQLSLPNTAAPTVAGTVSAVLDKSVAAVAPLALVSIFGSNLSKVTADLGGGNVLPDSLGGTTLTLGGKIGRLLYVSPTQINAQVPSGVAAGSVSLVVSTVSGSSTPLTLTVAAAAPAIFSNSVGGAVLKNADFSQVSAGNPATAGDIVLVYSTGLGQTTPPLSTGDLAPSSPLATTTPVSVTIGGQPATVLYSLAAPGFAGLYQTAVTVPSGVPSGTAAVVLSVGSVNSNSVNIAIK